jgi:hypothetical protein
LGTDKDNSLDMVKKGRCLRAHGETHYAAKLTEADVKEIKRALSHYKWGMLKQLSDKYGVQDTMISKIQKGQSWKDVTYNADVITKTNSTQIIWIDS